MWNQNGVIIIMTSSRNAKLLYDLTEETYSSRDL